MFNKVQEMLRDKKQLGWLIAGGVCLVLVLVMLSGGGKTRPAAEEPVKKKGSSEQKSAITKEKRREEGYLLGEEIDRKAFVARLEEQYHVLGEKQERFEGKMKETVERMEALSEVDGRLRGRLKMLEYKTRVLEKAKAENNMSSNIVGEELQQYQLDVVSVNEIKPEEEKEVYLPAGSFVHGVLLTGVYAPADQNNPLPVLIRLSEAFFGPNETRIPLEGAFVIGKATGDLNSERALIQGAAISAVFTAEGAFEARGNIGYVTDVRGQLGVKGEVVRNTGAMMAMSFMTGFLSGASEAFADSETTAVVSDSGHIQRNTTGNAARQAGFQGLSESARNMSTHYQKQSEGIVPAVKVNAGTEVYLVVLEGVSVHGLKNYMDDDHGGRGDLD